MLTRVKGVTLVEQVTRQLVDLIETGQACPGEPLPSSAQLAEGLGVSRAVVREALKSLEARGFVKIANGKNAVIQSITSDPLVSFFQRAMRVGHWVPADFVELRRGLEVQSAQLAALRRTPQEVAALWAALEALRQSLYERDVFTERDLELHLLIAQASRNTMLVYLLDAICETLKETIGEDRRRPNDAQVQQVYGLHHGVVETIAAGNQEAAGAAMACHFDAVALVVGSNGLMP